MNERRYDAILLLGLELDENDQPAKELCIRAQEAARQYHKGAAPVIIACGGKTRNHQVSEADVMHDLLVCEHVPSEAIIRENESQDTIGNMRFAAKKLGGSGRRVLVVTSDYHLFRSVLTARRAGFCARGCAAKLEHDRAWKMLRNKEFAYTVDMLMGWQDEGKSRPAWTYKLFDAVFSKKPH